MEKQKVITTETLPREMQKLWDKVKNLPRNEQFFILKTWYTSLRLVNRHLPEFDRWLFDKLYYI